jgi:hypothetical protein
VGDHMISVEQAYQYSVNIKYDLNNPARVRSYVPTESFVNLVDDVIQSLKPFSTDRARIVIGPYGTGKSHLVTVLAALLRKHLGPQDYKRFLYNLCASGYEDFADKVSLLLQEPPFMVVILDAGEQEPLHHVFRRGLKRALLEAGLVGLMPHTVFQSVEDTIDKWREQYPKTLDRFEELIGSEHGLELNAFLAMVEECDSRAVEIFRIAFPQLSAGAEFDVFNTADVPRLYLDVSLRVQAQGYRGVYVFFDEFNKYLEPTPNANESIDLKLLQDMAEMCNRSGEAQVHLMLISHQHISQYASALAEELVDTWRKIEGRFTAVNIRAGATKTYRLISAVIQKEPVQWANHVSSHELELHRLLQMTKESNLFAELREPELNEWVLQGCYPLHPSTVFVLPRICNRLAQNQRTLFTFLATKDLHTLGSFLDEVDQRAFRLLTLDVLFDYFEASAIQNRGQDSLGRSFLKAKEAIAKLGKAPDPMALRIIKGLAIAIGLEEPSFPATAALLRFALAQDEHEDRSFDKAFEQLLEDKLIYERKSDGRVHFLTASDTDFSKAIEKVRGDFRYTNLFSTCHILNQFFAPYPIIANKYNDVYEMTRFFYQEFFSVDQLLNGFDWDEYLRSKNYADGIVAYVVCETDDQCKAIAEYVKREKHKQVVFVYCRNPLNTLSPLAHDYLALHLLKKDKGFLEADPYALSELEAYLSDYEEQIERFLAPLIGFSSTRTSVFHSGKAVRPPRSRAELSRLVSQICLQVFGETPRINNELLNRTNVTKTVANARKKVVHAVLSGVDEPQLGLRGFGPDVFIFRSMLRRPRIYREVGERAEIALDERVDKRFRGVIELIQATVRRAESHPISFNQLFDVLRWEPYGLRPGVLPVFLAIALRDLRKQILIRDQNGIEVPLDAELIEAIAKKPADYSVETMGLDDGKESYLKSLCRLFAEFLPGDGMTYNHAYPIAAAMKRWFVNLPRFTRECRMHSPAARSLSRVLSIPMADSSELLFRRIPELVSGEAEFKEDEVKAYVEEIGKVKKELEVHLRSVRAQLEGYCIQVFGWTSKDGSLASAVKEWYSGLSHKAKTYAFSGTPLKIVEVAKSIDAGSSGSVLEELIHLVVGLDLADWSDEVRIRFENELREAIESIKGIDLGTVPSLHQRVSFPEENGVVSERFFPRVEVSELGSLLYSQIQSALDGFADAIPLDEKRQVLLNLLKDMS